MHEPNDVTERLMQDGQLRSANVAFTESIVSQKRNMIIGVLYVAYAGFYLSRKADSVIKSALHEQGFTMEDLALADTVYLIGYTVFLAVSGVFGSMIPSNKLMAGALICLSVLSIIKSHVTDPRWFVACQFFHAFFQSAGWPTCIKLLGVWVTQNRGMVMGFWTTCQSVGGIVGALWATYMVVHYNWQFAYLYMIPVHIVLAILCLVYIDDGPQKDFFEAKYSDVESDVDSESELRDTKTPDSDQRTSMRALLSLPGVIQIAVAYFFLKFLRYALLMWLPFYYQEGLNFDSATAGYLSICFEMGGMIGTPLIGWFSDRYMHGSRDLTSGLFLTGASVMLGACIVASHFNAFYNGAAMFLVGILVIGPDSVLSGTIAQDLANSSGLGGKAIGTLAGLINSVGSCGSIFQSYATALISDMYGWNVLFAVFVCCAAVSAMILLQVYFSKSKASK